jgi:hypothetical protein
LGKSQINDNGPVFAEDRPENGFGSEATSLAKKAEKPK